MSKDKLCVSIPEHNSALCMSLYRLQQDGLFCDVKIRAVDGYIMAHAVVLSASSSYFKEIITKMEDNDSNVKVVSVESENVSDLKLILDLLYLGSATFFRQDFDRVSKLLKLYQIETDVQKFDESAIVQSEDSDCTEKKLSKISCRVENRCTKSSKCMIKTKVDEKITQILCSESEKVVENTRRVSPRVRKPKVIFDIGIDNSEPVNREKGSFCKGRKSHTATSNETFKSAAKLSEVQTGKKNKDCKKVPVNVSTKTVNNVGRSLRSTSRIASVDQNLKPKKCPEVTALSIDQKTPLSSSDDIKQRSSTDSKTDHELQKDNSKDSDGVNVSECDDQKNEITKDKINNKRKSRTADTRNQIKKTKKIDQQDECKNNENIVEREDDTSNKNDQHNHEKDIAMSDKNNISDKDNPQDGLDSIHDIEDPCDELDNTGRKDSEADTVTEDNTSNIVESSSDKSNVETKQIIELENIECIKQKGLSKCPICSSVFDNYSLYMKHKETAHPVDLSLESIAGKNCDSGEKSIPRKNNNLVGSGRTYCKTCDLNFSDYKSFLQHRKEVKHVRINYPNVLKCEYCEYTTKVQCYLDMHKVKKHGMNVEESRFPVFRCTFEGCGYFNLRKCILRQHILDAHNYEKSEVCEVCGKTFRSRKQLNMHVKMHIPKEQRIPRFQCPDCDRKFVRKADFVLHFKHQHKKEKSFLCHLCPYGVTSQRLLDIHLYNVHQVPLPDYLPMHHCTVCDYSTPYKHYLQQHLNRHKGTASFKCHICDKAFSARPNLTAHLWRHNTENKKCPYDGCKYEGRGQKMKEHIKYQHTHKDVKPFCCPLCTYQAKTKSRVKSHLNKFHKMKSETKETPILQKMEMNNPVESFLAAKQIAPITIPVTANGNIELDTMVNSDNVAIVTTEGVVEQENNVSLNDPATIVAVIDSMDIDSASQVVIQNDVSDGTVIKNEDESDGTISQLILGNDVLSAIQDSKNVIIYHANDGLQYGAVEVVDY